MGRQISQVSWQIMHLQEGASILRIGNRHEAVVEGQGVRPLLLEYTLGEPLPYLIRLYYS